MLGGVLGPAGAAAGQTPLDGLPSQVRQFINAVQSPSLRHCPQAPFNFSIQALRDHHRPQSALPFGPIFQVMTDAFRKVAGLILPVMEQLRPVIESVSQSLSGLFIGIIKMMDSSSSRT